MLTVSDSDGVELLHAKALEILRREINNLFTASSSRKLNPVEARDLVAYFKLLNELKDEAETEAGELTENEAQAALEKLTGKASSAP